MARAIIGAVAISGIVGMITLICFAISIPNLAAVASSPTPIAYLAKYWFGSAFSRIFLVTVVYSVFSLMVVQIAAIGRLIFSLSRDNMFPGSKIFARVDAKTKTPVAALALTTIIYIAVMVFAAEEGNAYVDLIGATPIFASFVYLMIVGAYAARRNTHPEVTGIRPGPLGNAADRAVHHLGGRDHLRLHPAVDLPRRRRGRGRRPGRRRCLVLRRAAVAAARAARPDRRWPSAGWRQGGSGRSSQPSAPSATCDARQLGSGRVTAVASPEETMSRLRREEFPVTAEKVWFDTATYGPLPVSNVRAQTKLIEGMMLGVDAPGLGHWWDGAAEVRGKVGQFIGCDPADVALLRSTGEGISLVSLGLDWQPGDEVVVYDQEFPSGVYPFLALEKKGVKVVFVEDRGRHRFDVAGRGRRHVGPDPRRVHQPGQLLPRLPRAGGADLSAVPGARVLAAGRRRPGGRACCPSRSPRSERDLVSAHGYKSMCAGYGISFCYVSAGAAGAAWRSRRRAGRTSRMPRSSPSSSTTTCGIADSARRYEPSVQNLAGMYGLGASIDLFLAAGPDQITDWVLGMNRALTRARSHEKGYRVVSSDRPGEMSGIISAEVPGGDVAQLSRPSWPGRRSSARCATAGSGSPVTCSITTMTSTA